MKQIVCTMQLVLFTLVALPGATVAYASPHREAAVIYLPILWRDRVLMNDAVSAIEPAAVGSATTFQRPLDATPDPDGNTIYFTAMSSQGAGVFSVPATGGETVTLAVGAPLTAPVGLAVSTDGQTIYVADPSTVVATTQTIARKTPATTTGAIFRLPSNGGPLTPITTTIQTAPRGLTVVRENNSDMIYFTGSTPDDGQPALMKVPATGGALTIIEQGGQLVAPVGIAVNKNGVIYVADEAAAGAGLGTIFQFNPDTPHARNNHAELLADRVRLGSPAGMTLTLDESLLLVSSLDTVARTSQVLIIDTATHGQGVVNKVIGVNQDSGGLHRAHNNNVMAWAGVTAGTGGQGIVFRVTLP
ncbi:MAG: hypothetical protein R3E79_25945 [Caldilineaceae bacterium]